jgi:hypothetical protein
MRLFRQNRAIFSQKRLVTLTLTHDVAVGDGVGRFVVFGVVLIDLLTLHTLSHDDLLGPIL